MYIRKYISVYKKIYRSIYENIFPHMRKFRHLLGAIKTLTLNYLAAEVRYSSRIRRHSELLRCFEIFFLVCRTPQLSTFSVHDTCTGEDKFAGAKSLNRNENVAGTRIRIDQFERKQRVFARQLEGKCCIKAFEGCIGGIENFVCSLFGTPYDGRKQSSSRLIGRH